MKKFLFSLGALLTLCGTMMLTSCSDNDDPQDGGGNAGSGNFEEPAYEQYAAKYEITTPNADYQSVELTASGNYLIECDAMNASYAPAANNAVERKRSSFFYDNSPKSRAYNNGIIYGTYTKISDTEFRLAGFGTIKIISKGGNAYDLEITTENGEEIVLGANRENQMNSSTMTDKLCRTWNYDRLSIKAWYNNRQIFNQTYNKNQFNNLIIDGEYFFEDNEYPEQVLFSKAGTYIVFYHGGRLAVSTWAWDNESKGIARYSWDYDYLYDPDNSGIVTISFNGNQLYIDEVQEEIEDGESVKIQMGHYLSEAK